MVQASRLHMPTLIEQYCGEPGFFRLCYAGLPTGTVEAGVGRIIWLLD